MLDLSNLISVASLLFAYFCFHWNRRENRLDALAACLRPLIQALQGLNGANDARRKAERLRVAYPNPEKTPEAVHHFNSHVERYNELISDASDAAREFERELAARKFRFPDRVGRVLQSAKEDLAQLADHVSNGFDDQADVLIARLIDHHTVLSKQGRGWRLADPIEGLRARLAAMRKTKPPEPHEHDLDERQMKTVLDLVAKRFTGQVHNSFVVHPPRKLLDNPSIATSDNVIAELSDSVFEVVFQDGTHALLNLPEMMTFTYQLLFLIHQHSEIQRMLGDSDDPADVKVSFKFSVPLHVMKTEVVKVLLSKIDFSTEASDDAPSAEEHREAG